MARWAAQAEGPIHVSRKDFISRIYHSTSRPESHIPRILTDRSVARAELGESILDLFFCLNQVGWCMHSLQMLYFAGCTGQRQNLLIETRFYNRLVGMANPLGLLRMTCPRFMLEKDGIIEQPATAHELGSGQFGAFMLSHQLMEGRKKEMSVVGSRCRFGMVLHRKDRFSFDPHAGNGVVI